jgi:hypothetical protein
VNWKHNAIVRIILGVIITLNAGVVGYSITKSQILSELFESRTNGYASALENLGAGRMLTVSSPPQDSGLPEDQLVLLVVDGTHKYLFAGQDLYASIDREDAAAAVIGLLSMIFCATLTAIAAYRSRRTLRGSDSASHE